MQSIAESGPAAFLLGPARPAVIAVAAGVGAVAGSYAVAGASSGFVVAPVATLVVALSPDVLVNASITLLGDLGSLLALLASVAAAVALLAAAALPGSRLAPRSPAAGGLLAGAVVAAVAWLLTAAVRPSLAAGAAAALVAAVPAVSAAAPSSDARSDGRRQVLGAVGTALGASLLGYALAPDAGPSTGAGGGAGGGVGEADGDVDEAAASMLATADDRSLDVDGIEGLVSDDFYTVDIAQIDPSIAREDWSLSVTGNVEEELTYGFADVAGREYERRFVTLRCVGENLNGRKCDTALWTGVPIWDLVEPAGVEENCCVMLRAADDFYEEFPLAALREGFLAVRMNGRPLPTAHGAPARALIPGHWGEINVKWLTEVEVLAEEATGYWEERGWHGTGPVNTVAKLWAVNRLDGGRVEVAGHAYAGTRGIERVEVSTDGGGSWTEATLSEPLPGVDGADEARDAWRQWVHRYEPAGGAHDVVVRAVDGTGTIQSRERTTSFPSGPSGWVSRTVRP